MTFAFLIIFHIRTGSKTSRTKIITSLSLHHKGYSTKVSVPHMCCVFSRQWHHGGMQSDSFAHHCNWNNSTCNSPCVPADSSRLLSCHDQEKYLLENFTSPCEWHASAGHMLLPRKTICPCNTMGTSPSPRNSREHQPLDNICHQKQ